MKKIILFIPLFLLLTGCSQTLKETKESTIEVAKECVRAGGVPISYFNEDRMAYSEILCISKKDL